ncbi:MAG: carbohydrate binding domain-containing protein [Planctomycetes bacterium]|nr:carbohydrate binding domain-containing protein [Planctomycetota bacterium]
MNLQSSSRSFRSLPRALAMSVLVLGLATRLVGAESQDPGLANAGFEDGWVKDATAADSTNENAKISGQVATGWSDNSSWADVQVVYAEDTAQPHRGTSCQRITVNRVGSGAIQYIQQVGFTGGKAYNFTVWMRGRQGTSVSLALRQHGAPYEQYAGATVMVGPEWREYSVEGVVPVNVKGIVMVKLQGPGEVFLDDARLSDLSDVSVDAPPQRGNQISGGSFEAGMPFGWSTRTGGDHSTEFLDPRPVIDETTKVDGRCSYRIDLPNGMDVEVRSHLVRPTFNRAHATSLWLKASKPGTRVRVELQGTPLATDATVGTEWQRVVLTGTVPFMRWTRLDIRARAQGEGPHVRDALSLWIDAVQLEEAAEPSQAYAPKTAHEISWRLAKPGSIVHDGEAATIDLTVVPAPPAGAKLRLKVSDVYGNAKDLAALAMPATSLALPPMNDRPRGVFKLTGTLEAADGKALSSPIELVWARLPKPCEIEPAKSFFGLHIPITPDYVAMARACGMRWARVHDTSMITKWPVTETAPGVWRFYDKHVDAAHDAGMAVLGMLDGAPRWVSSKSREGGYWGIWHLPDLPEAPAAWENYVRTVVGHYKGRIDAWEMWNEPWGDWWVGNGGTPDLYAKLMAIAFKATKEVNPQATFVGVDTYRGAAKWHNPVLAAAKLDSFDVFSFHDYNDSLYGGANSMAHIQAAEFNAAQAKHGKPKPLWNTEGGALGLGSFYAPDTGGLPLAIQMAQAVRYDVTMMGAGVGMFCFYAAHSDPAMGHPDCAIEWDRAIKPLLAGRAVLAAMVDGAGAPSRSEPVPGVDLYTYSAREGSIVSVAWSHDGESHALPVPAKAKALDIFGNALKAQAEVSVGPEPIYLVAPAR